MPEDAGVLEAKASRIVVASWWARARGASLVRTLTSKLIESSPGISQTWSSQACQAIRKAMDVAPAASAEMLVGRPPTLALHTHWLLAQQTFTNFEVSRCWPYRLADGPPFGGGDLQLGGDGIRLGLWGARSSLQVP